MRRIFSSRDETFNPAVLYLEDIEEIVSAAQEVSETVRLRAHGYELDSIDELRQLRRTFLTDVEIGDEYHNFSIYFRKDYVSVYIGKANTAHLGLVETVKQVVRARRRRAIEALVSTIGPGVAMWLGLITLGPGVFGPNRAAAWFGTAVLTVAGLWALAARIYRQRGIGRVVPAYRVDRPGLVVRNLDRIVVAVVSAIVGAAFTAMVGHFA